MRRWLVTGLLVVFLIAAALMAPRWAPPLLEFAKLEADRIQAVEALLQVVLLLGSGVLLFVGWWRGKKKVEPTGPVAEGKTAVAVGRDVHGDVIVIHSGAGLVDPARLFPSIGGRLPAEAVRRATEQYLTQLLERFRYLEHRGMGVSDRLPLRLPLLEMFVPLKARVEAPEGETWERKVQLAGRRPTQEELDRRLSEPQPVLELLKANDGLILLGDPGAGKTTLLKFLALALATGQGEALGLKPFLPVLFPLSSYAGFLEAGDLPLDDAIARHWQDRGVEAPLAQMLETRLAQGGVLLLLDGLDEIRDPQRRLLVVERVKDFYCAHRGAGNKFVLTSRIVGYREVRPEAEGLAEATLVDFDEAEIAEFVQKWTQAVEKAASGAGTPVAAEAAERERTELLEAVRRNPGVRSLAANPLLLTILALMKRQGVTLPERRVELYKTYVETLLKHWNLARSLSGRSGRDLDIAETMKILPPLALWMHQTSPGVGLVKEMDLHRRLGEIYRERGHGEPEQATRQFLEDVREHAALLLDRGGRQYGFIHLTFQEYLAAVALAQSGQKGVGPIVEALVPHVGEPAWHEVVLLTVGYLGILQQRDEVAGDLVNALLDQRPGPAGEAVVLAGQAVVDAGSGGVPPACRKRVVGELLATMKDDSRVEARRRALAGNVLADLGDPRPEVTTLDGMEFCRVPRGEFQMGSDGEDSFPDERPVHRCEIPYDYWIGRYPVTMGQLRELVDRTGFEIENRHLLRERCNHPARGVSWDEAAAFCERLTALWRETGKLPSDWSVRLASEAEWEKAARGGKEIPEESEVGCLPVATAGLALRENEKGLRRYPWGDLADPNRANYDESEVGDTSSMGCFPGGASPYGCEEMSGNVWEWTSSLAADYPYPPPGLNREKREARSGPGSRVARGGSFICYSRVARCAFRYWDRPALRLTDFGFRVVVSPFTSGL